MISSERIHQLVRLLQGRTLRDRVGLWLVPPEILGHEPDYAASLGLDAVDVRSVLRDMLPSGTRFAGLDEEKVLTVLDRVCEQVGLGSCVLVYNFDLLLARLDYMTCRRIWQTLQHGFPHRARALLVMMPQRAEHLLPFQQDLPGWERDQRLVD